MYFKTHFDEREFLKTLVDPETARNLMKNNGPDTDQLVTLVLSGVQSGLLRFVKMLRVAGPDWVIWEFLTKLHNLLHALEWKGDLSMPLAQRGCAALNAMLFPLGIGHYKATSNDKNRITGSGQWPFIPASLNVLPKIAGDHPEFFSGKRFIDVGCGPGEKVFQAALLSKKMECYGVEYDAAMKAVAENVRDETRVFLRRVFLLCDDAINMDFSQFDRVYTYYPMRDHDKLVALYKHIWEELPNNAMWYEVDDRDAWSHLGKELRGAKFVGNSRNMMQLPRKRPTKKKKKKGAKK